MKNYFSLVISRFRNDQPKGNLNILEEYPGDIKLVTADSKKNQTRIAGYFQGKGPSFYPMSPYKRGVIYDMVKENFSVLNKNIFPGRIKGTIPKLLINQFSWNSGHGIFSISVEYKTLFGNKIIKYGDLFNLSESKPLNFIQVMYVEMIFKRVEERMKKAYREFENIGSGKDKYPFTMLASIDNLSVMFGKYGNGPFVVVYDKNEGITFYTTAGEFICKYNTDYDF